MISCNFEDGGQGKLRHTVVNAILVENGKILLEKRAQKLTNGGKWSLVGGFVDRDETLSQAIEREILEETGYKIKDLRLLYIIDNPDRRAEDRQNIAFCFLANAGEKTGEKDWESTEVKWFSFEDLPSEEEMAFDHFELINLYLKIKDNLPPETLFKSK